MKHGIVGRITEGNFRYQGWPSVCRDERGVLYAVCSGHRLAHICPFGKNLMYVSYDDGVTWSCPIIVNDTVLDDRDAGILSLGDGKMLLSWFDLPKSYFLDQEERLCNGRTFRGEKGLFQGILDQWKNTPEEELQSGSFIRLSDNHGLTWSPAIRVPVTAPHGPNRMKNGDLIYLGKCMDRVYSNAEGIVLSFSHDNGLTWGECVTLPFPESVSPHWCHEPHIAELADGTLLAATRVHENGTDRGENFTVYLSRSKDGGKTWSVAEPTGWCGSPPHIYVHSTGAVIITYARRMNEFGTRGRVSFDNGKTWSQEIILSSGPDGDLGYPCTTECSDSSLLTVYYQRVPEDRVDSILQTTWNLSEVK